MINGEVGNCEKWKRGKLKKTWHSKERVFGRKMEEKRAGEGGLG